MSRPIDDDGAKSERLIFPVTPEMSAEIEEFWHDQRLRSKSDAIRTLVQASLDQWKKWRPPNGTR